MRRTLLALVLLGACSSEGTPTVQEKVCDAAAEMTKEMVRDDGLTDPGALRDIANRHNLERLLTDEELDIDVAGPALAVVLSLEEERQGQDDWLTHYLDAQVLLNRECES